jgi:hypothetical protein
MLRRLITLVAPVVYRSYRSMTKQHCDPAQIAAQTRAESMWRRQQVRHLRAKQAACQYTQRMVTKPGAWLAQGAEILLFSIKMLCAYWAAVAASLLIWCLVTSTPISEVSSDDRNVATTLASQWLMMYWMWWAFRLRLPFKSPFMDAWRKAYKAEFNKSLAHDEPASSDHPPGR